MSFVDPFRNRLNPQSISNEYQFLPIGQSIKSKIGIIGQENQVSRNSVVKKRELKTTVMLMPDYFASLDHEINMEQSCVTKEKKVRKSSSLSIDINQKLIPQSKRSENQKRYEILQNNCLIQKYLWDISDDKVSTENFQKEIPMANPSSFRQSRVRRNSSSMHHYQIKSDVEQRQNELELRNLELESCGPIKNLKIHKESMMSKKSDKTCATETKNLVRDTNIQVWHSKRLKFGSNVLKFGIRNKDVVIIVYNDYQQNQLLSLSPNSFIGHPKSSFSNNKQCQKSRLKWSEFIRTVNKTSIIAHLSIKQILEPQRVPNKKFNNIIDFQEQSTTSEDSQRKIRIETRKQFQKQYNIQLTFYTKNRTKKSKNEILLDVVDHILDQFAKDSKIKIKKSFKQSSYSQILRKNQAISDALIVGSYKLKKKPDAPNFRDEQIDFKSVSDVTQLQRGHSFSIRNQIFDLTRKERKKVSEQKRRHEASLLRKKSHEKTNFFDFLKNFSFCCTGSSNTHQSYIQREERVQSSKVNKKLFSHSSKFEIIDNHQYK